MSSYLDELETQLVELTERRAHQPLARLGAASRATRANRALRHLGAAGPPHPEPPRRRRPFGEILAFAAVLAVTAGVAAVFLTAGSSPRSHRVASPPTSTAHHRHRGLHRHLHHHNALPPSVTPNQGSGGPVPSGFVPTSFTATDELHWWLLGTAPCSSPPCTSVVRTTDGGRTFAGLPAPRTTRVSELRFADPQNGFAYGPDLYATHDGGRTWQSIGVGGSVGDLAIADGEVYAIVAKSAGSAQLMRAPASGGTFSALPGPGVVAPTGLWVHGSDVLVQSGPGYGTGLLVSRNGGDSFTQSSLPVGGLPCSFVEQSAPVVWARCNTGMASGVWRSTDGGASFHPASPSSGSGSAPSNQAVFAAATSTTAVFGDQGPLHRTTDSGANWSAVGPSGLVWLYLGFTDDTHGVAIAAPTGQRNATELFYTTDAGASYHRVPIH